MLERVDPERCPDCDGPVSYWRWSQPALLRHGGYGATRQVTARYCLRRGCGWSLVVDDSEVRP